MTSTKRISLQLSDTVVDKKKDMAIE